MAYFLLSFHFFFNISRRNIAKHCLFPLFRKHMQKFFQKFPRIFMHHISRFSTVIIYQWIAVFVCCSFIYFTCRDPIHKHLYDVSDRHLHSYQFPFSVRIIIKPVFIMMLISSFVMKPCRRIPFVFPFCIIRTSCSLIIPASDSKFRPSIFRQIMKKSLPIQTYAKTFPCITRIFIVCDRLKMFDSLSLFLYSCLHFLFFSASDVIYYLFFCFPKQNFFFRGLYLWSENLYSVTLFYLPRSL